VIASFSPTTTFAFALVTVTGHGFDPTAANDVVRFGNVTARADSVAADGTSLEVFVPDGTPDVLDGPITVTTPNGTSAPSEQRFAFKGLGHLRHGTAVDTVKFLHQTPGVAMVGGKPYIASLAARGVIGSDGVFVPLPAKPLAMTGTPDGSAAFVGYAGGLLRTGPSGTTSRAVAGIAFRFVAAALDNSRLFAVGEDPLGAQRAFAFDPLTLQQLATRDAGVALALGAAAIPGGKLLVVGTDRVALFDPASASTVTVAAPAGATCAGPAVAVGSVAVVAFADGTLRSLSLGATPAWDTAISTGSSTPVAALVYWNQGGPTGTNFAAFTKPAEGIVRQFLPGCCATSTSALAGRPRALAWDGNTNSPSLYVANDESNNLDSVAASSGSAVGRVLLPIGLGSAAGCGQGSATDEQNFRFLAVERQARQLASINRDSLALNPPVPLAAGSSAPRSVVRAPDGKMWIAHDRELGTLDGNVETLAATGLAHPPECLLFPADGSLVVTSGSDVSVLRGGARTGGVTLSGPVVQAGIRDDGKVVVIWGDAARPGAWPKTAVWDLAALERAGAPAVASEGSAAYEGFLGALLLAQGPFLLFTWDVAAQAAGSYGVLLDASLAPQKARDALVPEDGPLMSTPDASQIVWTRKRGGDRVLRFVDGYDLDGIRDYAALRVDGDPLGPAFDATGEYLYVPVPERDEIAVFQ